MSPTLQLFQFLPSSRPPKEGGGSNKREMGSLYRGNCAIRLYLSPSPFAFEDGYRHTFPPYVYIDMYVYRNYWTKTRRRNEKRWRKYALLFALDWDWNWMELPQNLKRLFWLNILWLKSPTTRFTLASFALLKPGSDWISSSPFPSAFLLLLFLIPVHIRLLGFAGVEL